MSAPRRRLAALALLASLAATGCDAPRKRQGPAQGEYGSVTYRMEEEARNGRLHPVPPTYTTAVDTRSKLVLSFGEPTPRTGGEPGPDWRRTRDLLALVEDMASEYARLNVLAVDVDDAEEVEAVQRQASALDDRVAKLLDTLLERGLGQAEVITILSGRFDGAGRPVDAYANLTRWLRVEIERLKTEAEDGFAALPECQVSVEARLDPVVGTPRNLHIPDWDKIAAGELAGDPAGTKLLSPGDRRRLQAQLQAASEFKAFLEELDQAEAGIQGALDTLRKRFARSVDEWEATLEALVASLDEGGDALEGLEDPELAEKAAALKVELDGFRSDVDAIRALGERLKALRDEVLDTEPEQLVMGLADAQGLVTRLGQWTTTAGDALAALESWKDRIPATARLAREVVEAAGRALARSARDELRSGLEVALQEAAERLPATFALAQTVAAVWGGKSAEVARGAGELADADADLIFRDLDDLVPARVDLDGLAEDDELVVRLRFYDQEDGGGEREVVHQEEYVLVADKMGWYRDVTGALIFARGDQGPGDAKDWKPNVAAMLNWHYQYRDPEGSWEGFWNAWNPGIGIHVATLDQGDQSVELGLGVNLSLWDQYLYGGVGWNLNVDDDRLYYFLGSNLFEVLNAVRRSVGGS